jgi:hypothetical protein
VRSTGFVETIALRGVIRFLAVVACAVVEIVARVEAPFSHPGITSVVLLFNAFEQPFELLLAAAVLLVCNRLHVFAIDFAVDAREAISVVLSVLTK